MKKMKTASLLIASIMVFSVFFGCNNTNNTSSAGSEVPISGVESQSSSSSSSGKPAASSSAKPNASSAASAASTPSDEATSLKNIVTSNKEFNKLFAQNPIDKAYLAEMEKASSTADMVKVNEKYNKLWQAEVTTGYKNLMAKAPEAKKKSYQNRQEKWVKNTPDDLKKIADKAQSAGAMAQLELSGETMEHYRERAAAIYKNLYTHNPKFTYAYSAK